MPALIDGVIRSLRADGSEDTSLKGKEEAQDHGIQRSQQGYHLEEVIWEFSQLRLVLMEEVTSFELDGAVVLSASSRNAIAAKNTTVS